MKQAFLKKFCIVALGFVLALLYMPRLSADEDTSGEGESAGMAAEDVQTVDLIVGDIQTVPVNNLSRVSVTNPDVADISDAQNDKVTVLAKKQGTTVLFLWDEDGKHNVKVRVTSEDLNAVKDRIQRIMDEAKFTGVTLEVNLDIGKVVIEGGLLKEDKDRLGDILEPYSDNLLNLVKTIKDEDLIQVDMQIVEISTSLEKNLGIQWGTSSASTTGGSTGASSSTSNSGTINLNYNEQLPSSNGSIGDFFKIGNFFRTSSLEATVNALVQEGKARLISKPRLVVVSGKQASFLVGGEIPINNTTTNSTGTSSTTSTSYSQYGVNMSVTPTIREGKIDVLLNVDIRDIDSSTPISSGNVAFITRTATTDLLMENKQTIALAGLIKYEDSVTVTEVPFLSKIPILGALFRNRSEPGDTNTEMVIILTPVVLTDKKFSDRQVVMPTPLEREGNREIEAKYEYEAPGGDGSLWPAPKVTRADSQNSSDSSAVLPETLAYARMVQQKISLAIPKVDKVNDLAGTVKLKLHILKDGSLDSEEVAESSGIDALDQDALQAAKIAAPYDVFTAGMDQDDLIFTVPIVYNKLLSVTAAPVNASNVTPDFQDTSAVLPATAAYARQVQEKISKAIFYPQAGSGGGDIDLAGTVKLKLHILKDGSLDSEEVAESSGNEKLDNDAMQAAKTAAPYDAFTTGMDQDDLVFTVPIVYNKLISEREAPAVEKAIAS